MSVKEVWLLTCVLCPHALFLCTLQFNVCPQFHVVQVSHTVIWLQIFNLRAMANRRPLENALPSCYSFITMFSTPKTNAHCMDSNSRTLEIMSMNLNYSWQLELITYFSKDAHWLFLSQQTEFCTCADETLKPGMWFTTI